MRPFLWCAMHSLLKLCGIFVKIGYFKRSVRIERVRCLVNSCKNIDYRETDRPTDRAEKYNESDTNGVTHLMHTYNEHIEQIATTNSTEKQM